MYISFISCAAFSLDSGLCDQGSTPCESYESISLYTLANIDIFPTLLTKPSF